VAVVVVLAITAVWYIGLYKPETSHIKSLQTKQQQVSASLLQLDSRYTALVMSEKNLPAERSALVRLGKAVPNGPELDNLVTTLYAAAAVAGVKLTGIGSPQPANFGASNPAAMTGPAQVALSASVTGSPAEIEHLVKVLDHSKRLFVVDGFSLSFPASNAPSKLASTGPGAIGSTLTLRAFYASPSSDNPATPAS
jgi:Tfp pilus assembly protein PilO